MKISLSILIIALLFSCTPKNKTPEKEQQPVSWAIKFADATMTRYDSLVAYLGNKPKYEYDLAFLDSAIDRLGTTDQKYSEYAKTYIDYFVQEDGKVNGHKLEDYNIDRVRPGLNMLDLYERSGEEKYKIAIETLVSQMETHPRTNAGGFWHKKIYPYQMWLDGLYMASPFLARYARDFNQPKWFDEVTFQIQEIYKETLDANTGLLYLPGTKAANNAGATLKPVRANISGAGLPVGISWRWLTYWIIFLKIIRNGLLLLKY